MEGKRTDEPQMSLSIAGALVLLMVGVGQAPAADEAAKKPAPAPEPLAAAYIAPMSHLDLTFMGTVEECLSRGGKVFAGALDLLGKQPDFHFLIEYVLFLDAYRAMHPEQARQIRRIHPLGPRGTRRGMERHLRRSRG